MYKIYNLLTKKFIDWDKNIPNSRRKAEDLLLKISYKYQRGALGISTIEHKNPFVLFSTEIAMKSRYNRPADYLVFATHEEAEAHKNKQSPERKGQLIVMSAEKYLQN